MPMMNEQTFMYMPVTPYGIGIDMAKELAQKNRYGLKSFPEVQTVFAKVGRAISATDPAPYLWLKLLLLLNHKMSGERGWHIKTYGRDEQKLQINGLINSWTYPIRGRIDILLTGIRTPLGIKTIWKWLQSFRRDSKKV